MGFHDYLRGCLGRYTYINGDRIAFIPVSATNFGLCKTGLNGCQARFGHERHGPACWGMSARWNDSASCAYSPQPCRYGLDNRRCAAKNSREQRQSAGDQSPRKSLMRCSSSSSACRNITPEGRLTTNPGATTRRASRTARLHQPITCSPHNIGSA